MKTCPVCASGTYNTYSNGRFKEGYCERCSYESKEPTAEMDAQPVVVIDRRQGGQVKKNSKGNW